MSEIPELENLEEKIPLKLKTFYEDVERIVSPVMDGFDPSGWRLRRSVIELLNGVAEHLVEKKTIDGLRVGVAADYDCSKIKRRNPQVENLLLKALIAKEDYKRTQFRDGGRLPSKIAGAEILMESVVEGEVDISDDYYLVAIQSSGKAV